MEALFKILGPMGTIFIFAVIVLGPQIVKICTEWERGVIFRLGKYDRTRGPGLFFLVPLGVDRMIKTDLRVATMELPSQEVITRDNVDQFMPAQW